MACGCHNQRGCQLCLVSRTGMFFFCFFLFFLNRKIINNANKMLRKVWNCAAKFARYYKCTKVLRSGIKMHLCENEE